jgi:hypothetical protein
MEGIGEQGLFIIAALVIAFINWLSSTLKKKQAAQRNEANPEEAQALQRQADEEAQSFIDDDSWPSPDDDPDGTPSSSTVQDDPNQNIREFFAALSGTPPVEAPPVPVTELQQASPVPPPPVALPGGTPAAPTSATAFALPAARGQSGPHPIIRKLRQEGGAREAFIFSEILGKPKSLRQPGN